MHAKLTSLELRTIEKKLDERWAILQRDVHDELVVSAVDSSVDLIGRPAPDGRDSSVIDALVDLNLASIERHIHEIRAIKTAKERIHNGTYGTCERCSHAISVGRLLANPSVELCHHCQSEFEKVGQTV